ncbi:NAD-binding protein [Flagelloscypha sp. PMI_526]|nr:NAD-binding protein [Flagelloscypha sp. PMI_526]
MASKIVICGAGFLGSNIARAIAAVPKPLRHIQIASRHPDRIQTLLRSEINENLLAPLTLDITKPSTLKSAFTGTSHVVSLVAILRGSPTDYDQIQWKGAENVARAANEAGAHLIHFSAIGADRSSSIPYNRTKGLAEESIRDICGQKATIIRPSLVFGPDDDFFNRFSRLSKFLPFMPVFGGGKSKFQPVFVGDIARAVEIMTRGDESIAEEIEGKTFEAGGPNVFSWRELMEMVLTYSGRRRPIVSVPFSLGKVQGAVLEQLPTNLFTITRDQVELLKSDNVASNNNFQEFVVRHSSETLKSIPEIVPTYIH